MINYSLASSTWGDEEISAIHRVIRSDRYTMGPEVQEFEEEFANAFGSKYAVMVNSGSSANLIGIAALIFNPDYNLNPGDEVIVPAVGWATSYYPLQQYGLKIKFVDIDIDTLNFDLKELKSAVSNKTRAVLGINLLGNPNPLSELSDFCNDNKLILIEDNCESMGAKYKDKFAGTFGVLGTFSCFFSHHISTMEGGLIVTDNETLYEYMKSLRAHGWTRGLPNKYQRKEANDFSNKDDFHFILPGYNVRPCEMSGAIGKEQIKKLPDFIRGRRQNAQTFQYHFQDLDGISIQKELGESSWFGFSMILNESHASKRKALLNHLNDMGVETRPIVTGNFCRNPVIKFLDHTVHGGLANADKVHDHGFFIGNNHEIKETEIIKIKNVIQNFLDRKI